MPHLDPRTHMTSSPLRCQASSSIFLGQGRIRSGIMLGSALLLASHACIAQVPTCSALTLYGNAINTGLCKSLSPATQNLWVCALADNPDIHTTFNAATALHVTVRLPPANAPACQGPSTLGGNWPAALTIAAGQPNTVCNIHIQNWVDRLNAVPQMPAANATLCRTPFLAAGAAGKISQALMQSYLATCTAQACP